MSNLILADDEYRRKIIEKVKILLSTYSKLLQAILRTSFFGFKIIEDCIEEYPYKFSVTPFFIASSIN